MSRIWKNSTGFSPKFFSLILAVVFAAGFVWFTDTQAAYAQDANIDIQVSNNTPVVGETITFTINISYSDVLAGSAVSIVNEGQLICQNLNREVDLEFSIIVPGVIVERTNGLANGVNSYICPVIIENETDFVENFEYDYTPIGGPSQDITIIDIPIDVIAAPDTPQIELIKSPAYQVVEAGQQAVFTFTIKNTGNVPLEKITVEDSMISNCKFIISPLTAGEVFTKESFSCEITADQSFTNTAEVTAVTSTGAGQVVTDTAEAFVEVINDGGNPDPDVSISVKGMVINHEEKLVAGVPLYAQLGDDIIKLVSDENGEFEFDIPKEGNWLFSLDEDLLPADWVPVTSGQFYVNLAAGQANNYQIRFKIRRVRVVEVIKVNDSYQRLADWIITASPGPENVFAKPITATTDLDGTAVFTLTEGLWSFTEEVPAGSDISFEHVIPKNGIQELIVDTQQPFNSPYTIYFKNRIIEEGGTGGCIDIHKRDHPADFGIQGWYIEVLRMDGTLAAMGYTDVEGNLKIEDLPSGPYKVVEEERAGWQPVTAPEVELNVVAGQACQNVTFVNEQTTSASGFCLEGRNIDINGRYGLPDWEITIKPAVDGGFEHEPDSVLTDGLGQYRFDFPNDDYRIPGSAYEVCEIQQEGWVTAFTPECQIVYLPQNPDACVVVPDFVNAQVGHDLSQYHTPTPYPTPTEIPTQAPPTYTPVPPTPVAPTAVPTYTPEPPTAVPTYTPSQPTVVSPTYTPVVPTDTPVVPTYTPTYTPVPPTPVVVTPTPMPMPSPTVTPTGLPDGHQDGSYGPAGKLPPASKNDGATGYSNYDEMYPQGPQSDGPSQTQIDSHNPSCRLYHVVHPGEGLSTVAAQYSLYHKDMLRANPWVASQKNGWVYPGQQLCVPYH